MSKGKPYTSAHPAHWLFMCFFLILGHEQYSPRSKEIRVTQSTALQEKKSWGSHAGIPGSRQCLLKDAVALEEHVWVSKLGA